MKYKTNESNDNSTHIERDASIADGIRDPAANGFSSAVSGMSDASSTGRRSQSGIYDVSRMTNIRSPMDASGHTVANFTKKRGVILEKRAQSNSDLVRGLLIAMAVPLAAGAAYLMFSGKELYIEGLTYYENPVVAFLPPDKNGTDRSPAARATLPPPVDFDTATIAEGTTPALATVLPTIAALDFKPRPLAIQLDSTGKMVSPFSVELDENGDEVKRREIADQQLFMPSLPLGAFEDTKLLSQATLPKNFVTATQTRPYVITERERVRIMNLLRVAPEIKTALRNAEKITASRLQLPPISVASFTDERVAKTTLNEALSELKWLHDASFVRDVSGDRAVEKRIAEVLMVWARTYRPTGSALDDLPLIDAIEGYSRVRHLWRSPEQAVVDTFLRSVVDAQFARFKSEKHYGAAHGAHVLFALTVGYVIDDGAYQLHGITQYRNHIENSPLLKQDAFGPDELFDLKNLLHAAVILDRAGSTAYRSQILSRAVGTLEAASQSPDDTKIVETLAIGTYFRSDLYTRLTQIAQSAGMLGTRFGTDEGALLAAIRKPTSTLDPRAGMPVERIPSAVPTTLPPKRNN